MSRNKKNIFLMSGEIAFCAEGEIVSTILGSCIAVCIFDEEKKIGGMSHFLIPRREMESSQIESDLRYGDQSTLALLKFFKEKKSDPRKLKVYIVGGASGMAFNGSSIGAENLRVVIDILGKFGVAVTRQDVGGDFSRKVEFDTLLGEVRVLKNSVVSQGANSRTVATSDTSQKVKGFVAIGSSTGGTEVIRNLVKKLPDFSPPIFIVQHMPDTFTAMFSQSLNSACALDVVEAADSMPVQNSTIYVAPGNRHMSLVERKGKLHIGLSLDPPVNSFRPSVDYLFFSLCESSIVRKSLAIMLTGMGNDGASGMKALKDRGSRTIAQNEESCVVFGMPKSAIQLDAVDKILSPEQMVTQLVSFCADYKRDYFGRV